MANISTPADGRCRNGSCLLFGHPSVHNPHKTRPVHFSSLLRPHKCLPRPWPVSLLGVRSSSAFRPDVSVFNAIFQSPGIHVSARRHALIRMNMPAMSPTMTEGGIASWKKAEGDSFAAGDVLLEIVRLSFLPDLPANIHSGRLTRKRTRQ